MIYSDFEKNITDNSKNFSREILEERDVAMTIGTICMEDIDLLHIAVVRVKGVPFRHTGLRTNWHVATAEDAPLGTVSDIINKSDVTVGIVENPQLITLRVGRNPLLPDDSLLTVSPAREFYPTLLVPKALDPGELDLDTASVPHNDRYQIVVPLNGVSEI